MAATKNIIAGNPSAADTLELGKSGGVVQVAAGARFKNTNIGSLNSGTDSQAAGTLLAYDINLVTSAADASGLVLPVPTGGETIVVQIVSGAYAANVYPHSGGKINGGSANSPVAIKEALPQVFRALSSTAWSWQGTVNS